MEPVTLCLALFVGSLLFGCQINKEDEDKTKSSPSNKPQSQQQNKTPPSKPSNICPHCNKPLNKKEDN